MTYEDALRIAKRWFKASLGDRLGEEFRRRSVIGSGEQGGLWTVDLYLPGAQPADGIVVATVAIDADGELVTGVVHEETFELVRERLAQPEPPDKPKP
jgi:hypothetical protein